MLDAELALKAMDKKGSGTLTREEMHSLMKEHLSTQRSLWNVKKLAIFLAVLVLVLSISTLGLSFAAAILAKDTKSTGDDLVDNKSGQVLGVQSAADDFGGEAESVQEVDDNGNYISSCDSSSEEGETKCTTNSWTKLDLQHGKAMVEDCAKDRTVHLTRMFSNEREMHYAICPVQEGYSVAFGKGPLVQQGPNKRVYYPTVSIDTSKGMIVIKPNEELTHYEITGGAVTNSVGFPCDADADCDATLECKFECVHKTS